VREFRGGNDRNNFFSYNPIKRTISIWNSGNYKGDLFFTGPHPYPGYAVLNVNTSGAGNSPTTEYQWEPVNRSDGYYQLRSIAYPTYSIGAFNASGVDTADAYIKLSLTFS
jgi:hypothetical protein